MIKLHEARSGFTVIELLITITICGIMVPVLAIGLANLTVANNRSRDLALVNMVAQNKVELLRSSGFNSISLGSTDFSSDLPSVIASPKSASYTVTSPTADTKEITVNISYKDYQDTRTIQYKTVISETGVGQ